MFNLINYAVFVGCYSCLGINYFLPQQKKILGELFICKTITNHTSFQVMNTGEMKKDHNSRSRMSGLYLGDDSDNFQTINPFTHLNCVGRQESCIFVRDE